ncbi:MAG: DUF1501 domain-containing protein [Verrucomicrobiales bacterium]|nr:DUF1501 domain-containing protein [Verrucomicrobiales bacterium]
MDLPSYDRRQILQRGGLGLGWLSFSALAHAASATTPGPHFPARARRVIFLSMRGGPSHVDLWDHKPTLEKATGQTPAQFGGAALVGAVQPLVQRGRSGLWMSPLMPHLARHADDLCVINSMHTDVPNHAPAFVQMHTGSFQFVRPSLGAWTLYGLGSENQNLPGFVTLNPPADNGGARNYGSAFLPSACQGTRMGGSQIPALYAAFLKQQQTPGPPMKNIANEQLSKAEQRAQLRLIRALGQHQQASQVAAPEIDGMLHAFELAFRMQSQVPETLDLSGESQATLDLYGIGQGKDAFARQCLLARRLAEAGVRFIEIASTESWDHHTLIQENLAKTCGETDRPIAALLSDLKQRGLLRDTLVVWAGEFGRTPYMQGIDGRDHNHKGFSIWMAGGGVKGGHTYGATDDLGYRAVEDAMHIHDWHATVLHLLGLDHTRLRFNYGGRDFRLTETSGQVAHGLIA